MLDRVNARDRLAKVAGELEIGRRLEQITEGLAVEASEESTHRREEGSTGIEWARRVRLVQTRARAWVESAAREALHIVQVEAVREWAWRVARERHPVPTHNKPTITILSLD